MGKGFGLLCSSFDKFRFSEQPVFFRPDGHRGNRPAVF